MSTVQNLNSLESRTEAVDFLRATFETQLGLSIEEGAEPNKLIAGDTAARQAFNILLSPVEKRAFFRMIVSDSRYWPRIKSLVGNPPFSFLLPEDNDLLRAGGICKNRKNMYCKTSIVSNYSEFGLGHFYDANGRIYKVINNDALGSNLPWRNITVGNKLILDVRLRKYSHKAKVEIIIANDTKQASLMFPRPGQSVKLHISKYLENNSVDSWVTVRVDSGYQKARNSSIARLVVTTIEMCSSSN